MLTQNDIRHLHRSTSRKARFSLVLLPFFIVFLIAMGLLNVWLAHRFGEYTDLTLSGIALSWFKGFEVNQAYPGTLLKAIQRFETGLTQIVLSALFILLYFKRKTSLARDQRLLNYYRSTASNHGVQSDAGDAGAADA